MTTPSRLVRWRYGLITAVALISTVSHASARKAAPHYFRYELQGISQNALDYLPATTVHQQLISKKSQQQLTRTFLQRYFSPWGNHHHFLENSAIKHQQSTALQNLRQQPGWGADHYPLSQDRCNAIGDNMDLAHFPNRKVKGITIYPGNMKILPTSDYIFGQPGSPGDGYPFDNNQESWVNSNVPVLILHETADGAWRLVLLGNNIGWLSSQSVAVVSETFIQQWQHSPVGYVTTTALTTPLLNQAKQLVTLAQVGNLHPLKSKRSDAWVLYAANGDAHGQAVLQAITIPKPAAVSFPLPITGHQLAEAINKLMAIPYSWGGLNGCYDCSSILVALFQPFGIWLPRNSSAQANVATPFVDLHGMNKQQKFDTLVRNGVPLLTLLWMPGHVMLYLGQREDTPYVFNAIWGLKTEDAATKDSPLEKEGRALIGMSVIMPLTIDDSYTNIPCTLTDKLQRLIPLTADCYPIY